MALALGALLLALGACSTATPSPTAAPGPSATAQATVAARPTGAPATPSAEGEMPVTDYPPVIQVAVRKLADDLHLAPDQVQVLAVEQKDWPDTSLGCPEPGKAYLQVITPGYRAILQANGQRYEYHTNRRDLAVRCPR
ncbi:MAG TPA: hypothetical protein VFW96_11915 [Thermomicrobiales bacterium]|nr:hypothetical protein [Thermomicrobiales bacterium]